MNDQPKKMTKAERDDLCRLIKQRERLAKTAAEQRSAAMLAEFEMQITAAHPFDTNDVWNAAVGAVQIAAKEASQKIAAEAAKLGIPEEFRPSIQFQWDRRGSAEVKERREELRRLAKAEIAAIEKLANVQIETASVDAQSRVIANGLGSEDALAFFASLPPVESMMPALDISSIQQKLVEQARMRRGYTGPRLLEQ